MIEIIVACSNNFGIGINGRLPWKCKQELEIFKNKTLNNVLIMGRKTFETLPELKDRIIICITSKSNVIGKNNYIIKNDIKNAIDFAKERFSEKKIFIAGGAEIYQYCLEHLEQSITKIHISILNKEYETDRYFNINKNEWCIKEENKYDEFTHYILVKSEKGEKQYLDILNNVINNSVERNSRNSIVKSTFFKNMTFDIRNGFPLLTTKKMFFRGIVEELLFFIRGDTDSKILENKGVNIWKGNTSREFLDNLNLKDRKEGIMGPLYGYQWRYFNSKYDETTGKPLEKGIDQFKNVIDCIKNNSESRRILMTDFNPEQASQGVLYPCHSIILQFYVDNNMLDMSCYNRSQDLFLGVPFNIASSALLLCIVSKICNKTPRYLHMCMGDVHIYQQHYEQVKTQCNRQPYLFPTLKIKDISSIEDAENLTYEDFILENYHFHPIIKAEMIV